MTRRVQPQNQWEVVTWEERSRQDARRWAIRAEADGAKADPTWTEWDKAVEAAKKACAKRGIPWE